MENLIGSLTYILYARKFEGAARKKFQVDILDEKREQIATEDGSSLKELAGEVFNRSKIQIGYSDRINEYSVLL